MYCSEIYLNNYRNIEEQRVSFSRGVNFVFGENAQGKTNLLEAVYTFARGKSFRNTSDKNLCRDNGSFYVLENIFIDKDREKKLRIEYSEKKTKRYFNEIQLEKSIEMISRFRAVLFCPDNLDIVKGSPSERREFINIGISQLNREYVYDLSHYIHSLDNKNAMIHKISEPGLTGAQRTRLMDDFEIWDEQLAKYSAKIAKERFHYVENLSPYAEYIMAEISENREKLRIRYVCDVDDPSDEEKSFADYLKLFRETRQRDIAAGSMQHGVHRDEVNIKINGDLLKNRGSQGQQRSAVLAMKMAEGEISRDHTGDYPVFLFDDVLSELDENRKRFIFKKCEGKQLIITGCEMPKLDLVGINIIKAEKGIFETA